MLTTSLKDLLPIQREDVNFLDIQFATGETGLITAVHVPYSAVAPIIDPEEMEPVRQATLLATLSAQVHHLVRLPQIYVMDHASFDYLNPFSREMMNRHLEAGVLDGIAQTLMENRREITDAHATGKPLSLYYFGISAKLPRLKSDCSFMLGFMAARVPYDPEDVPFKELFNIAMTTLERNAAYDGELVSVTGTHNLSQTPSSMNLTPFRSTDYREYKYIVDAEGTDIDPDLTNMDNDPSFNIDDALDGMLNENPLDFIDRHFVKGSDEYRELIFKMFMKAAKDLDEGVNVPMELVFGLADRFIENEKGKMPEQMENPMPLFLESMGLPSSYSNVYNIEVKGRDDILLHFAPFPTSLEFAMHYVNDDVFTIPGGTYVLLNSTESLETLHVNERLDEFKDDIMFPVQRFEGVKNVTDTFMQTLKRSVAITEAVRFLNRETGGRAD